MISLNTNISAMQSIVSLNNTQKNIDKLQKSIATGKRINMAGDDPAGISLSTKMSVRISSMKVAKNNVEDAISVTKIADGGLKGISDTLQAIRALAVKAKSDTLKADERDAIQASSDELIKTLDSYVDQATFNGIKLLDGTADLKIQSGADVGDSTSITIAQKYDSTSLSVNALDLSSAANSGTAITAIDDALALVDAGRTSVGALQNGFQAKSDFLSTITENLASALSNIQDTNIPEAQSELLKQNSIMQANMYALSQSLSNSQSILQILR